MKSSLSPRLYNLLFVVACMLAAIPVLLTTYPPMIDLPQHAAQIAMLDAFIKGTTSFSSLFEINWFTPYWLGYSIIWGLSQCVGIVMATKLVVAASVVLFPISAAIFYRRFGGNKHFCWAFIMLAFGSTYYWGFLNFLMGVPIGFLFLSCLPVGKTSLSKNDVIKMIMWAHLLFFTHVLIMAFFLTLAAILLHEKSFKRWVIRCTPYLSVVPITVGWMLLTMDLEQAQSSSQWAITPVRFLEFFPSLFSLPLTELLFLAGLLLYVAPFKMGYKISSDFKKWGPFALYCLMMFLGPFYIFGNAFTYTRFAFIGLPFFFFMLERDTSSEPPKKWLSNAAFCFILSLPVFSLSYSSYNAWNYDNESKQFSEIMDHIPEEKRLLNFIYNASSKYLPEYYPIYIHFGSWYQAEKKGVSDFNFAEFYPQVMRYKTEANPAITERFLRTPEAFNWETFEGENYDYFLVKHDTNKASDLFPEGKVLLVKNTADWWLYKREKE